ncbi:MAG: carboxypeptidase-like regulatory domain-containing protein [Flavobacteriaceae bacterium]
MRTKSSIDYMQVWVTIGATILILVTFLNCSKDDGQIDEPTPTAFGNVSGKISDGNGLGYPKVEVILKTTGGAIESTVKTDANGLYEMNRIAVGNYSIEIVPPLGSTVVNNDKSIAITDGGTAALDFSFEIAPKNAVVVLAPNDALNEVRNESGDVPSANEPIYTPFSVNDPNAEMVPVLAPDGHHITLQEWKLAQGSAFVTCEDNKTKYVLEFSGLIPNGVYTLWNGILKTPKGPSDPLSFQADLTGMGALGESNQNVMVASETGEAMYEVSMAKGSLSMFGSRPGCEITETIGFVLVVDYHIDGNTYGPTPGPDNLDVAHMTIYF